MTGFVWQRGRNDTARIMPFLFHYWRRRPWLSVSAIAAMLISVGIDLMFPYVSRALVDTVAVQENAADLPDIAAQTAAFWALGLVLTQNFMFHLTRRVAFYLCWIPLSAGIMQDIVEDAFARVQKFDTDWHTNSFAGATVRKISRGMWAYDTLADTLYIGFLPAGLVLLGVVVGLLVQWPLLGMMTGLGLVIYLGVTFHLVRRYVAGRIERMVSADSTIGAGLADAVTCNAVVKAFGAERREEAKFHLVAEEWRLGAIRAWRSMDAVIALQDLLLVGMQALLIGYAVWQWTQGLAEAGDVVFAITTFALIGAYTREIGMHFQRLQNAMSEIEDVVRFSQQPVEPDDRPFAAPLICKGGAICFEKVGFTYPGQNLAAFSGFSVDVAAGEKVALVGRSGSGKSTFVRLLQGLYQVERGRVLIDGQDITHLTHESLRRAVALVPQEPVLFHRSIAENIAYAWPEAPLEAVRAAARQARADKFIDRLPNGYDTLVGERGVKLSGGERQRVAIARAFLADAPILVLDEATSSLDAETEAEIQAALDELMATRTTIVIAHRLSTIRAVDRILVFEEGRVVEEGSHDALMARPEGAFRRLHATQLAGVRDLAG